MSTRTNLRPTTVINAKSMSSSIISSPTILQSISAVSYVVIWSEGSTPVGSLSVEVSNDFSLEADGTVKNAGIWVPITLTLSGSPVTGIPVSGDSGSGFIDVPGISAYAIRLHYTRSSGSGTMTSIVNGKVA